MSRETDSSSSGPQGRGGAAYPSGTPPYGSRQYPSPHPQQDASEETGVMPVPQPDEPRTETTLTTRIRINIPGSRPIPPVVMRTPVGDGEGTDGRGTAAAEQTGSHPRPDAGQPRQDEPEPRAEGAADDTAATPTSDWFAPRKASNAPPPGGMGAGAAAVAGTPGQSPAGQGGGQGSAGGRPELPYGNEGQRQAPHSSLSELDSGGAPRPGAGGNAFTPGGHTPPGGFRPPGDGPNGPTTGPVTGSSPLTTPPSAFAPPGSGGASSAGQGPGAFGGGPGGPPRMSDDTAVLTPQVHAPEPAPGGHVSGDTLTSGIPVVPPEHRSPFPGSAPGVGGPPPGRVSHPDDPSGHGQDADRAMPSFPGGPGTPAAPGGPSAPRPKAAAAPAPKKKGRSKLVLLTVALVVVAGGLYGAGLLMNHSAVPKGTTVLGVDIGGGTRDQAVNILDSRLGKLAATPMELNVGGKTEKLPPDKAGLTLDSQATVRNAAVSDYNPVSVVSTLFGGKRVVEPVIPVDDEKLSVALTDLAGVAGSAREGTIKFEPGKAVAVPGKAGETLDVKRSMLSVQDAYRAQVQTGRVTPVELPVAVRQPAISQAEIDRAMKEFAEPAMSGLITISAGGKQIQFGPAKSLPRILSMKAVDGKLVEYYDRKAIDELLDGVFDGITITRADGQEHPVNSADVALAMQKALRGKTTAERTQEIDLDPS
ncbi:hypothetical protein [Streptomyces liangshanensis]